MSTQFRITAQAKVTIGGIEYGAAIEQVIEVENGGQVTERYESLWALVYRQLQIAQQNMPKGAPTNEKLPATSGLTVPQATGTQFIPLTAVRVQFDQKRGDKQVALLGGQFVKFGITLYPERTEWRNLVGAIMGTDPFEADGGDHPIKGLQMIVTKTSEGKYVLNDVRPL